MQDGVNYSLLNYHTADEIVSVTDSTSIYNLKLSHMNESFFVRVYYTPDDGLNYYYSKVGIIGFLNICKNTDRYNYCITGYNFAANLK